MPAEFPTSSPENKEVLDDNAFKFTVASIDPEFLASHNATSFLLTTDWLEMTETSERKLAHKQYENGDVAILFIQKFRHDGRTTVPPKEKLTLEQYQTLIEEHKPKLRVAKMRHEFDYTQDGNNFTLKYDEFIDSELRVLEVDAASDAERELFSTADFEYPLTDVTGQLEYYGYRVAKLV